LHDGRPPVGIGQLQPQRGIAQNTLNSNGKKNQQMVEKAVQKMFKQWPK
jgi:hypothetical protein